jgi:hypothetical protein
MSSTSDSQRIIAKLINARHEIDDALRLSVPGTPYHSIAIPQELRNELSMLRDDLARIIYKLEESLPIA